MQSFAEIAQKYNYVRPSFSDDKTLKLENSRHPVVERVMDHNDYVPNDCNLDNDTFIYLITGPNMSGKSTYMRQVAIISIMAQMGPMYHVILLYYLYLIKSSLGLVLQTI